MAYDNAPSWRWRCSVAFFPWKCTGCGASGSVRHGRDATKPQILRMAGVAHAGKSPQCHAQEAKRQLAMLRTDTVTTRDRHLLISARIKRKLMADALRQMRGFTAAPAERSGDAWDAWLAKVGPQRETTRKQFIQAKKLRNGYAFT